MRTPRLSIIIPELPEQRTPSLSIIIPEPEQYGITLDWCLQGCGRQAQTGSKFCSQECFRSAIHDQDEESLLLATTTARLESAKISHGSGSIKQKGGGGPSPLKSASSISCHEHTHLQSPPTSPSTPDGLQYQSFFSDSFTSAAGLYSSVQLCNRNAAHRKRQHTSSSSSAASVSSLMT